MRRQPGRNMVGLAAVLACLVAGMAPAFAAVEDSPELEPAQVKPRSQVLPYYPATARLARVTATVSVVMKVDADGKVAEAMTVACDQPDLGFEQSAIDAVTKWKFRPAMQGEEAVASTTVVHLEFLPPRRSASAGERLVRAIVAPIGNAAQYGAIAMGAAAGRSPDVPGLSTAVTDQQTAPRAVEFPNCPPGSNCMYDKSQLNRPTGQLVSRPTPVSGGAGR